MVEIEGLKIGGVNPLILIAGPCVVESESIMLRTAETLKRTADGLNMGFIFKSSYKKDNRSSATAYAGPGMAEGLRILGKIKEEFGVLVLSDVHCKHEVEEAAAVLDVLQIPAFLSHQTELTLAVGKTQKAVNVKKGQFTAPEDMANPISKIEHTGNKRILVTERGASFGYNRLVVDMRSFPILRSFGYPVVFDVTHSVRIYGRPSKDPAGGEPRFIPYLARAAVACGIDGIFLETHPSPSQALCDASSMLPLDELKPLLEQLVEIDETVKSKRVLDPKPPRAGL